MNTSKLLKLSIIFTNAFLVLLFCFAAALPFGVTWYVETMKRDPSLPTIIMLTCYPCVPFAAGILVCIKKLLKNAVTGDLFNEHSIRYLKNIMAFSLIIAVITLIAGWFYMPFFLVGATFAFLALLVFAFRTVFILVTKKED